MTTTFADPALWAGATAVICVALSTVYEVAFVPPKVTPLAPETPRKFVPVMMTFVVPPTGPADGERRVIVGES